METINATNIYYFHSILEIGGIETFFYYLAKKYKDWDLVIVYSKGNQNQLDRLKKYVKCVQYTGQKFVCERAFFNFNTDIIDNVTASKGYYLVLHGDYKDMLARGQLTQEHLPGHSKITNYIGISQAVCKAWEEVTGKKAELCYNPFMPDAPHKKLRLVSATRLSVEKGGDRIVALARELDRINVDYEWYIYSNRTIKDKLSPNIHICPSTLNIIDEIAKADFLVQLSDNEGYCYSVVEALNLGVPVVVTPIPVFSEINIDETNSIVLNFDLSNIQEVAQKIATKKFNFKYTPKKDSWDKFLIPGESEYQKEINATYVVKATEEYQNKRLKDQWLKRVPNPGETWTVDKTRYDYLRGENEYHTAFVTLVETIPKEDVK